MQKRLKFDIEKYIDHNYIEDDDAIISINIPHMNSFYNEFDADKLALSDDIIDFIDGRVKNISKRYNIVLEFITPRMSKKQREKIIDIIKSHYGLVSSSKQRLIKGNNQKAFVLLFVGLFFLLVSYSLIDYGNLVNEIFSIVGWVAAWESVNAVLIDAIIIRGNKKNVDRLYNAKVIFKEKNK